MKFLHFFYCLILVIVNQWQGWIACLYQFVLTLGFIDSIFFFFLFISIDKLPIFEAKQAKIIAISTNNCPATYKKKYNYYVKLLFFLFFSQSKKRFYRHNKKTKAYLFNFNTMDRILKLCNCKGKLNRLNYIIFICDLTCKMTLLFCY